MTPWENICSTEPETPRALAVAQEHEAHVTHTGIADDEFEIALPKGHRGGVNNSDDGGDGDPFPPHLETLRKKIQRDTQRAVSAELHDDAGEQHRAGGGRGHVTRWGPGMQRPDAGEDGEPEKKDGKGPGLQLRRKRKLRELGEIEG